METAPVSIIHTPPTNLSLYIMSTRHSPHVHPLAFSLSQSNRYSQTDYLVAYVCRERSVVEKASVMVDASLVEKKRRVGP
jgi:hypothetical protein